MISFVDAAVAILAGKETPEVHFKGLSHAGVTTEQEAGKGPVTCHHDSTPKRSGKK